MFKRLTLVAFVVTVGGCETSPSPPLSVTVMFPTTGTPNGGTVVAIKGEGFMPGAAVRFSGTAASVTYVGATSLSAVTPPHAEGSVTVVVTNPNGESVALAEKYEYREPAPLPVPTPLVTSAVPNKVSMEGGAYVQFHGAQFDAGAILSIDGAVLETFGTSTTLNVLHMPAHASGVFDVVVTNPNGTTGRLAGGLTFAETSTFNFNGDWDGYPPDSETPLFLLTVRNNQVLSIACGAAAPRTFAPTVPIVNGTFTLLTPDGIAMTGRMLADGQSTGTVSAPVCGSVIWTGFRR